MDSLSLDHERLAYRQSGRDFHLTDAYGKVVHDAITEHLNFNSLRNSPEIDSRFQTVSGTAV